MRSRRKGPECVTRMLVAKLVLASLWASAPAWPAQQSLAAFPGAEGFGAAATGGRGGRVMIVDTLEPFGRGSLGAALDPEDCGPRIVVFGVSGVIDGEFDLTCGDVTIAGQTAPGGGITIRGRIDGYGADPGGNIIIRHLRVRPPPPAADKGSFHDAIQLSNNPLVILDHVSASWAADEVIDLFENTRDITVQWSTIEESRIEGHPEGRHNYGMIVGPGVERVSIHHVLFAHHRSRCPAVATGPAEVVNTVAYNCQDGFVHHNPANGRFQIIGNTYRNGPEVDELVPFLLDDEGPGGTQYYLSGNRIDDPGAFEGVVENIYAQPPVHPGLEYAGGEEYAVRDAQDFSRLSVGHVPVTRTSAEEAYEAVLRGAGAFPRDGVTARTVQEVRDRAGAWGEEQPSDLLAGLTPAESPVDDDADGMADDWERANGNDPADGDDHNRVMASGYTAIEEYINELADELVAGTPGAAATDGAGSPDARVAERGDGSPASGGLGGSGVAIGALVLSLIAVAIAATAFMRGRQSSQSGR